jgi:basic membrane protein A
VLGWDPGTRSGLFTGSFDRTDDGGRLGESLLDQGVDVIRPVAGQAGLGTAAVALEGGEAYVIGVDSDWAVTYPEYVDIILTSVEKRLDASVTAAISALAEGAFSGGTHVGTLATGQVGLSPFHAHESLITPQVRADLEQITADIISGKIQTKL